MEATLFSTDQNLGKSQTPKSDLFNINYNKKLVDDPVKISNIFNDYFSNISSSLVKLLPSASTKFSDFKFCKSLFNVLFSYYTL